MIKVYRLKLEGKVYEVELEDVTTKEGTFSNETKKTVKVEEPKKVENNNISGEGEKVLSPMQGIILNVSVKVGDKVNPGQDLLILEAMKMENPIVAPVSGTVTSVHVSKGDNVDDGTVLVTIS